MEPTLLTTGQPVTFTFPRDETVYTGTVVKPMATRTLVTFTNETGEEVTRPTNTELVKPIVPAASAA